MPFCNCPLLGFSIEALASARMDKVYIYASQSSIEAIKAYIASAYHDLTMQIILRTTTSSTIGDVLREADALQLKTSFLLLRVGYIGNLNLRTYLDQFESKKTQDASLCMDCLVISSEETAFTSTFLLNPSSRILHYGHAPSFPTRSRWKFPKELLAENPSVLLRRDLKSIGCWICTADVLPLFTENFDYQNMHHFIHGILTSDLLGKTISCSEVDNSSSRDTGYATFIQDPSSYATARYVKRRTRIEDIRISLH